MVTEAKPIITLEELECYLPNRVRRSGKEYRTGTDGSRSGTNLAINLEKQVYYDFHYNQGGSLITLLRHLGAPISQDTARASPLLSYRYQVAILCTYQKRGAVWRLRKTHSGKAEPRDRQLSGGTPYYVPPVELSTLRTTIKGNVADLVLPFTV